MDMYVNPCIYLDFVHFIRNLSVSLHRDDAKDVRTTYILCCDNTHNLELCVYVCVCACVCVCVCVYVCVCVCVIHIYPCHVHVCNIHLYIHTQDHEASNKSYDAVITRMISNTRFRITFVHKRNCNTLQHAATRCNTLQHCTTQQHTCHVNL